MTVGLNRPFISNRLLINRCRYFGPGVLVSKFCLLMRGVYKWGFHLTMVSTRLSLLQPDLTAHFPVSLVVRGQQRKPILHLLPQRKSDGLSCRNPQHRIGAIGITTAPRWVFFFRASFFPPMVSGHVFIGLNISGAHALGGCCWRRIKFSIQSSVCVTLFQTFAICLQNPHFLRYAHIKNIPNQREFIPESRHIIIMVMFL